MGCLNETVNPQGILDRDFRISFLLPNWSLKGADIHWLTS